MAHIRQELAFRTAGGQGFVMRAFQFGRAFPHPPFQAGPRAFQFDFVPVLSVAHLVEGAEDVADLVIADRYGAFHAAPLIGLIDDRDQLGQGVANDPPIDERPDNHDGGEQHRGQRTGEGQSIRHGVDQPLVRQHNADTPDRDRVVADADIQYL